LGPDEEFLSDPMRAATMPIAMVSQIEMF